MYVQGYSAETEAKYEYNTYAGIDLQYFLDNDAYYHFFSFITFELDTSKDKYQQVGNDCEGEYVVGSIFVITLNIFQLLAWFTYQYWCSCCRSLWWHFLFSISLQAFSFRCSTRYEENETSFVMW